MPLYTQSTLGVAGNQITFNDFSGSPVYRAIRRRPTNRELREFDTPIPGESGIVDFETLIGQTSYIIDGTMYPNNETQWKTGRRALKTLASLDIAQDDPATDFGYVPYVFDNTQIFMKVLYVDLPESTQQGLVQPFRLFCKVKEPVEYGETLKTADTGSQPGTVTGYVEFPLEYPAVIGKNFYAISATATNNGSLDTYPRSITINGPVNRPRITNTTTGEFIEVDTNVSTDNSQLIITYDADSVSVEVDGNSVYSNVSSDSTFFKIQPGANTISLSGDSISEGAYARLTFYDAWPMS